MKCIVLIAFIMIIMIHMLKVGIAIFLLLAAYAAKNKEWGPCNSGLEIKEGELGYNAFSREQLYH